MATDEKLQALFASIMAAETHVAALVEERLQAHVDMPLALYLHLNALGEADTRRVQELAKEFSMTTGGVSKVIDRLEARGLCRRLPNPDDRRSSLIQLTPDGKTTLADARNTVTKVLREQFAGLSASTIRELTAGLGALRELQEADVSVADTA